MPSKHKVVPVLWFKIKVIILRLKWKQLVQLYPMLKSSVAVMKGRISIVTLSLFVDLRVRTNFIANYCGGSLRTSQVIDVFSQMLARLVQAA